MRVYFADDPEVLWRRRVVAVATVAFRWRRVCQPQPVADAAAEALARHEAGIIYVVATEWGTLARPSCVAPERRGAGAA